VALLPALMLGVASEAWGSTEEGSSEPPVSSLRLSAYCLAGADLYLSPARTAGGLGGGCGLRGTLHERFLLQFDASYLTLLGNVASLRVGVGVQRQGVYAPAVWVMGGALAGQQLRFLPEPGSPLVTGPAAWLGVAVAPLRFRLPRAEVSLLELGVGVGLESPQPGLLLHLGLLSVGVTP
jgi:hypothetical protein